MRKAAVAIAIGLGGLLGCSSKAEPTGNGSSADGIDGGGTADGAGVVGCDDPREQAYAPNMSQPGASNVFTFVLVSSSPAPPADETNVFTLNVLDSTGAPVTGATITVKPTMPLMMHGTSSVTVSENADGSYTLQPVYLFMAGLWEIAISASANGQKDTTSYYFCVAG
jgi:hypothetical protein